MNNSRPAKHTKTNPTEYMLADEQPITGRGRCPSADGQHDGHQKRAESDIQARPTNPKRNTRRVDRRNASSPRSDFVPKDFARTRISGCSFACVGTPVRAGVRIAQNRADMTRSKQILGSCSPASSVTTRSPPTRDCIVTMPAWSVDDVADDRRILHPADALHRRQQVGRRPLGNDGHQLAFVGDVQRVEAEHLAGPADFGPQRNRRFVQLDADAEPLGQFVQRARQSAARRVAHAADRRDRPRA